MRKLNLEQRAHRNGHSTSDRVIDPLKNRNLSSLNRASLMVTAAIGLLGPCAGSVLADEYWNGTGTDFSQASSWSADAANTMPGAVPGPADTAYFGITGYGATQTVFLTNPQSILGMNVSGNATSITGLTFNSSSGETGTNGVNTLTVGTGGIVEGPFTSGLSLNTSIVLNGPQTWSSQVDGTSGKIFINGNLTGNTGGGTLILNGGMFIVGPGNNFAGNLRVNGQDDVYNDFNANTNFTTTIANNIGAHGNITFVEPIVLTGGMAWYQNGGSATFANSLSGGQMNLQGQGGTGSYTFSGTTNNTTNIATGNSKIFLSKTSSPTVHAVGAFFDVNSGSTAQITNTTGYQFGTNTTVQIDYNTASSFGTLDFNGGSESFSGLQGGSATGGGIITNSAASTISTLTIGSNNPSPTFYGSIQDGAGQIALTKIGSGNQTLSGPLAYSGATNISGGTLTVTKLGINTTSPFSLSGGATLKFPNPGAPLSLPAIGATATASSQSQPAQNAIDGNLNTRWETPGVDPQWLEVDMKGVYNLASLAISFETAGAQNFVLETHPALTSGTPADPDGTADNGWNIAATVVGQASYNDKHFITYPLANASNSQYVAFYGTMRNTGYGYSIWELQAFQNSGLVTQTIGSLTSADPTTTTNLDAQLTLSTGSDNTNTTYAGAITGGGGLLKIGFGNFTLSNTNSYTGGTNVSGGSIILAASGALPAGGDLTIGSGASVVANNLGAAVALSVGSLSISGKLDLNNNDLIVHGSTLAAVNGLVASAYNGGGWNGSTGIGSTAASSDSSHLTALGVISNDNGSGLPLYGNGGSIAGTFGGLAPALDDLLVKYTYYGDANLDGKVDGSDYSRIDSSFLAEKSGPALSGWYNGDFNYDGVVDGSDYTLLDNAFNRQGTTISTEIAASTAQIAGGVIGSSAVPEPTTLGLMVVGVIGFLGRRRRAKDQSES